MKPLNAKKNVYKQHLVENVILAIKEKLPSWRIMIISLRQDNAKPHVSAKDTDILQAGNKDGFDLFVRHQPSNLPDFNILDLGWTMRFKACNLILQFLILKNFLKL